MCEWEPWFKTQHDGKSWPRAHSDFNRNRWIMEHNALLRAERIRLQSEGATVRVEEQNKFWLDGNVATLSGTPDLVSLQDGNVVIHDIKSGEPHVSHVSQVMLYMWAFPYARREYRGLPISGRVVYPDHAIDVPSSAIDHVFRERVVSLIRLVSDSDQIPDRTPSFSECRFCDITSANCPDRIEEEINAEGTDLF